MTRSGQETDELVARARTGDAEAFAQVFESFRPMIHRVAYRVAGPNDCDDVVMETYLKAWRSLPKFKSRSTISTWLCRIAQNCALDFRRRQSRRDARQASSDDPDAAPLMERIPDPRGRSPEAEAAVHDLGALLQTALAQLSEEHRAAILLREVDGLSYREVAAAAGVSIGTVMSRLFYARRKLRTILEASEQWER